MKSITLLLILVPFFSCANDASYEYQQHLLANFYALNGSPSQADHHFQLLLNEEPSPYAYHGYLHHLYTTKRYTQLLQLDTQLAKTFAHDPDTQLLLGRALLATGAVEKAVNRFDQLAHRFPENSEIVWTAANLLMQRKKDLKALTIVNRHLQTASGSKTFVFHFLQSQLYAKLGKKDEALSAIKQSVELQPSFDKGWLMLGLLHEQQGQFSKAITGYQNFLALTGYNKQIEYQLANLMLRAQAGDRTQSPPSADDLLERAIWLYECHDLPRALAYLERHLEYAPTDEQARLLTIEILLGLKRPSAAVEKVASWIMQEPHQDAWYQLMHVVAQSGVDAHLVTNALKNIAQLYPTNNKPLLYLADAHLRFNETSKALTYLQKALTATTDDQLKSNILFQVGLIHFEQHNWSDMTTALEQCEKLRYHYPPATNLLAYHYATKGKNLNRAQQLIAKTLAADPANPHFLDTQALIWYKQGNYEKAAHLLEKLLEKERDDAYITKHLGKTYIKMGNLDAGKQLLATLNNNAPHS